MSVKGIAAFLLLALIFGMTSAWAYARLRPGFTDLRDRLKARAMGAELLRTGRVIRQRSRNDCGAAALCNLLNLLRVPCRSGDIDRDVRLRPDGASLLDLKRAAERRGVSLEGWRFDRRRVEIAPTPFLAAIRPRHFVVVTRVRPGPVVEMLDPAIGHLLLPADRFERLWTGHCLIPRSQAVPKNARNDLGRQVEVR